MLSRPGRLPHRRGGTPSLHRRPHRPRGPAGQPAAAPGSPGLDRAVRGRLPHRRGPPPAPALPPHQPGRLRHHLRSEPATAANCSTNPPWPWTTPTCTSILPTDARGETLISGPLLGALRTVREVERLADAVENLPDDRPVLALLDGTLAFWDPAAGQLSPLRRRRTHRRTPAARPGPPAGCVHQPASGGRGRLHLTTPHHRGRRRPPPHALRAGQCRLQPSLHRPPFRPGVLRRRRRLRRP